MHHQWLPDRATIEEGGVPEEVLTALRGMGHDVRTQGRQGDAHSIWIGPDGIAYGANDKRTADSKASVPVRLTAPTAGR
jgi:gamma-glutamyltranspeptidase/glutathione hydrolase